MKIKIITRLTYILAITVLIAGFSACDSIQQILTSDTEAPTSLEERDHVWVVNQNGDEVPIPGTWVLVERMNLKSTYTIGESFTLPPDPSHKVLLSEGTYMDGEGNLWTKVNITTANDFQFLLLERVDTSVSPNQLHVVIKTDEDGFALLEYGEYPFELPWHDVQVWELSPE